MPVRRVVRPYVVVVATVLLLSAVVARSASAILAEREYWAYRAAHDTMHPGTVGSTAFSSFFGGGRLVFALAVAVTLGGLGARRSARRMDRWRAGAARPLHQGADAGDQ